MNAAQIIKIKTLESQWFKARKAAGRPADQAALDALKLRKIGRVCSSKLYSQDDMDEMVGAFTAEIEPGNFGAQMKQQNQSDARKAAALTRCRLACDALADFSEYARLDKPQAQDSYIAGVARKLTGRAASECSEAELAKIAGVIDAHVARLRAARIAHSKEVAGGWEKQSARRHEDTGESPDAQPMPPPSTAAPMLEPGVDF